MYSCMQPTLLLTATFPFLPVPLEHSCVIDPDKERFFFFVKLVYCNTLRTRYLLKVQPLVILSLRVRPMSRVRQNLRFGA